MNNLHRSLAISLTLVCAFLGYFSSVHQSASAASSASVRGAQFLETTRGFDSQQKLLVWIDVNATSDANDNHWLPADPALFGIIWRAITFSPAIDQDGLFWVLAEIQASQVERILDIPWVFNMSLVREASAEYRLSEFSKFSIGLEEAINRTIQNRGFLSVVIWLNSRPFGEDDLGILPEVARNVTLFVEELGGKVTSPYYDGSETLVAAIPPWTVESLADNLLVRKIYLNGPVVVDGFKSSTLPADHGRADTREFSALSQFALSVLAVFWLVRPSFLRNRKKQFGLLFLLTILSAGFLGLPTPATRALDVSSAALRAADVWASGNRGGGINIAVIDTGIDLNGNDFANAIVDQININDGTANVQDADGHGTHVAGIVAGRGVNDQRFRGVAWDAGLVIVRYTQTGNLEPAVRWVINNRVRDNIRIMTMSWRDPSPPGGDGLESPVSVAVDDAVDSGIVAIKSAGNEGLGGAQTITSPGNAFNVITVGAVDDRGSTAIDDDTLADFSSRGPTADGRPKPDVVSPGVNIMSVELGTGGYVQMTGTSMAAPHAAGTAALILNANPSLTPAQVKAILRHTARLTANLVELSPNGVGRGIIDAFAAVQLAPYTASIPAGQMYDSFTVTTPNKDLGWGHYEYMTANVDQASLTRGIPVRDLHYYYRAPFGIGNYDYKLVNEMSASFFWVDNVFYDIGNDLQRYLVSGPRIISKEPGYADVRAHYSVAGVLVTQIWNIKVDNSRISILHPGGPTLRALLYVDPSVSDISNFPQIPSTGEIVYFERKITTGGLLDVRDLDQTVHVQFSFTYPTIWILKYGYYGSSPDSALNEEYTYNRDIVVYTQGESNQITFIEAWISRHTESLPQPNPPPTTPLMPSGPSSGSGGTGYTYTTSSTDPNGQSIHYQFDWGDGARSWTSWYSSGATASANHCWSTAGTYYVRVRAQDSSNAWSDWSLSRSVTITVSASCGGGGSVFSGTKITMADSSLKLVQNLQVGMQVLSYDPSTQSFFGAAVTQVVTKTVDNLYVIGTSSGPPVRVDEAEFFWVETLNGDRLWLKAGSLETGYKIWRPQEGVWAAVTSISVDIGRFTVYDVFISPALPGNLHPLIANGYLDMKVP